jgi:hypothetical protein
MPSNEYSAIWPFFCAISGGVTACIIVCCLLGLGTRMSYSRQELELRNTDVRKIKNSLLAHDFFKIFIPSGKPINGVATIEQQFRCGWSRLRCSVATPLWKWRCQAPWKVQEYNGNNLYGEITIHHGSVVRRPRALNGFGQQVVNCIYLIKYLHLGNSQSLPSQLGEHLHWYPPLLSSTHCPPFWQGLLAHAPGGKKNFYETFSEI